MPRPFELIKCSDIVSCFQSIYNFFFMILLALAFLNFLYGAFQYLTSGAGIFKKEEGKNKMKNSIIAVIVVLLVPLVLQLINPEIFTNINLSIPKVKATLPSLIITSPETPPDDRLLAGEEIIDAAPDPDLKNQLENIDYISKLVVDCTSLKMTIYGIQKSSSQEIEVASVPIRTGQTERALANDKQYVGNCDSENISNSHTTPRGEFILSNKQYNPKGIISKETGASLGTRIITYYAPRGLLIHGSGTLNKDNSFPRTYGCIRMKNAHLAAIFDKIKTGETKLIIIDD